MFETVVIFDVDCLYFSDELVWRDKLSNEASLQVLRHNVISPSFH